MSFSCLGSAGLTGRTGFPLSDDGFYLFFSCFSCFFLFSLCFEWLSSCWILFGSWFELLLRVSPRKSGLCLSLSGMLLLCFCSLFDAFLMFFLRFSCFFSLFELFFVRLLWVRATWSRVFCGTWIFSVFTCFFSVFSLSF